MKVLKSTEAIFNGQTWLTAPYMARVQYLINVGGAGGQGGGSIISHRHILTTSFVLTPNFAVLNVFVGKRSLNVKIEMLTDF